MEYKISVSKAIQKARRILAPLVILPAPLLILILNIVGRCNVPEYVMVITFIFCLILIPIAALIYWKAVMIKWQIWAFTNVESIHELKKAAEVTGLINGYIKLGDVSDKYPKIYKTIEQKLNEPCKVIDDPTISNQVVIYFRKPYQQSMFYFVFVFFILGVFMLSTGSYEYGGLFTLVPIGIMYWLYRRTADRNPQLTLDEDGIYSGGLFTNWKDINDCEIVRSGSKHIRYTLNYDCPDGKKEIQINDLYIKPQKLNHSLFVYRSRYQAKHGVK